MLRLRHPSTPDVHHYLTDALGEHLRPFLQNAQPGHCLRITTLPAEIADQLCRRFLEENIAADVAVLRTIPVIPSEPWHKSASALIELRNDKQRPLLVFVPPGEPVPDSLEISTFNEIPLADIPRQLRTKLEAMIGEDLAGPIRNAFSYLRSQRGEFPDETLFRYYLTITINDLSSQVAGGTLYQLGLIPDFGLLDDPNELSLRLERNLKAVATLADPTNTLLARINALDAKPGWLQEALYKFLRASGRRAEAPEDWGREIATTADDAVRRLAFEFWEYEKPTEPLKPRIDIHPLKLAERPDDGTKMLELKRGSKLPIKWELDRLPSFYSGLAYFRIEIVSTEGGTVYETQNIKPGAKATKTLTLKDLHDQNIPDDLYFVRVRAYDNAGNRINQELARDDENSSQRKINESENIWFYAGDDEPPEATAPRNQTVRSFLEARLLTQFSTLDTHSDPFAIKLREANWADSKAASRRAETTFNIQYSIQNKFSLPVSTLLKRVEDATLAQPGNLGRWRLDMRGVRESHEVKPQPREPIHVPQVFLQIRTRLFEALREQNGIPHLTSTCNLIAFAELIRQYAEAYLEWLNQLTGALAKTEGSQLSNVFVEAAGCLDIDTVEIYLPFGIGQEVNALLLAPTHPLRLFWHLQLALATQEWIHKTTETEQPGKHLNAQLRQFMRSGLAAENLPLTLWHSRRRAYIDAGALTPFWHLYLPPTIPDSRAVRAKIERALGVSRSLMMLPTVAYTDLTLKIQRYLFQHPYITTLKLNVFNPGDASILREVVEALEPRYPHLNYQIRLFADQARVEDIGEALDDLTRPERQVGVGLDLFTIASRNPLFPKLKYSRGRLVEFLHHPADFEAHISILFDSFGVKVDNGRLPQPGRSSFLYGLIQESLTRFEGGDGQYVWKRQLSPSACSELTSNPGGASLISQLLVEIGVLQASLAATTFSPEASLALQLNLQPDDKELLHQIHVSSDWVLTIDRNLGLEYFDGPDTGQRPVYLLDFTPEFNIQGEERLLLTTRSTKEVVRIIRPVLEALGLEGFSDSERLVLEMLRSLSGRLALKLLSTSGQAEEALGLALARLFLEQYELLSGCVVIPLDAHIDLFTSHKDSTDIDSNEVSLQRGDLLLVSFNPEERLLEFNIVEVKCRQDLGSLGNYLALKEAMHEQLSSTEATLRYHFDPGLSIPDRLDRPIKTRELAGLLDFYRERALRYGSISSEAALDFANFIASLDSGYHVRFRQIGLVFDFGSEGLHSDEDQSDLIYHRVGLDYARLILQNGLAERQFGISPESVPWATVPEHKSTTMSGDVSFERVRRTFATKAFAKYAGFRSEARNLLREKDGHTPDTPASEPEQPAPTIEVVASLPPPQPELQSPEKLRYSPPQCDVLLAEGNPTPQYGLLGEVEGRKVGLDLDGCNTLSLFGVQGGGKSYTIGTIVEMAVQPIPGINALPSPLASVIFHYHESQDYPPEFVSMVNPNDRPAEIDRLKTMYGASPAKLEDVLLLTSADKLSDRRREFPSIAIEPIYFNSKELIIKDWLFLMGAIGNPSMYIQQVRAIMQRLRSNLTLAGLRHGIEESGLSNTQKELAFTRLSFAEDFIRDDQNLREKLRPGRLIIVDFRDELIQKEQALGLFVVMLNIFSGAGQGEEHFNKLIVFDEAHKYITHSDLTSHVVETIREMRHKGVSVIFASQDPPSLPATIIELSSVIILHKFNAPKWLTHLQKSVAVLSDLTPEKMGALHQGEAFVWANKATDPRFTRRPVKMKLRPRVTLHGGTTKKAVRE